MQDRISEEITFRKLEVLLAFLKAGNLTRAAELLDVSTVSVHRALHSLEDGVRCQLFRHEGRNLLPTDAAQVLADVAREVLKLMSDGIQSTRAAGGYSADVIRIGSLYSLTIATVPRVIMDLKVRRPELQTELVLGSNADLVLKLKKGRGRRQHRIHRALREQHLLRPQYGRPLKAHAKRCIGRTVNIWTSTRGSRLG